MLRRAPGTEQTLNTCLLLLSLLYWIICGNKAEKACLILTVCLYYNFPPSTGPEILGRDISVLLIEKTNERTKNKVLRSGKRYMNEILANVTDDKDTRVIMIFFCLFYLGELLDPKNLGFRFVCWFVLLGIRKTDSRWKGNH